MALRIPLTPDQTLQTEFHEIERRLRRLERATGTSVGTTNLRVIGGGSGTVNLQPILDRLDALEQQVADMGDPASEIPDFGAEGPTAMRGLVPSPGSPTSPTGISGQVLISNATWGYPFRGLVSVVTSGDQTDPAIDVLCIEAGLQVGGSLHAANIVARDVNVFGYLKVNGVLACSEYELSLAGLV
jgi:hypothetical protein